MNKNEEITLKDVFKVFVPKIWIILLCAVICAGAVFAYLHFLKDDTYTSSASVYVSIASENKSTTSDWYVAEYLVQNLTYYFTQPTFYRELKLLLPAYPQLSEGQLASMISAPQVEDTCIIKFFATSDNPQLSFDVVEAFSANASTIIKRVIPDNTTIEVKVTPESVRPAQSPNSKNTLRSSIIAALVGAIVSMAVIYIVHLFDVVVHDKEKFVANFDIPVFGLIPEMRFAEKTEGGKEHEA